MSMPARTAGLVALASLSACAMPPDGTSEDDVTFWESSVAAMGCQLVTERDYRALQFEAGLSRQQALAITKYELEQGRARNLDSGGIELVEGPCAPGAEGLPRTVEIAEG
jgi:hypothetical protein